MKSNLMMMAAITAFGMTFVSCNSDNENLVEDVKPSKTHVQLVCGMGANVSPIGAWMQMLRQKAHCMARANTISSRPTPP